MLTRNTASTPNGYRCPKSWINFFRSFAASSRLGSSPCEITLPFSVAVSTKGVSSSADFIFLGFVFLPGDDALFADAGLLALSGLSISSSSMASENCTISPPFLVFVVSVVALMSSSADF